MPRCRHGGKEDKTDKETDKERDIHQKKNCMLLSEKMRKHDMEIHKDGGKRTDRH